jgi:hypothetical protein
MRRVPVEDVERLADPLLLDVRARRQPLDGALDLGGGPEQTLARQQEQEGAEHLGIGQVGEREALAIALAAVGAVQAQLDEVGDQHPAAAVHLGGIAEGLLHGRQTPVAGSLLGVEIGARRLELQHAARAIQFGAVPTQAGIRRPVALHRLRAGLGLHVVHPVAAHDLAVAQQPVEDLAQELALEGLLLLAEQ